MAGRRGVGFAQRNIGVARSALHAWRIPAAMVFFHYGMRGELPTLFWVLAWAGDLLAGSYAASLLWRKAGISPYRRIHQFGSACCVLAVGAGLTFTVLHDPRVNASRGRTFATRFVNGDQ